MRIRIHSQALKETEWYEYLVRFGFGGIITAVAGLIVSKFGPVVGGLFLAFPAIFPASATLIEKHERKRKERAGMDGKQRGRSASAIDAAGAALGSIGLCGFGAVVWIGLPRFGSSRTLIAATIVWFVIAAVCWILRRRV